MPQNGSVCSLLARFNPLFTLTQRILLTLNSRGLIKMGNEDLYYIDLFDEYLAMRISWNELAYLVETLYPKMQLDAELERYKQARDCLQIGAMRSAFPELFEY